MTGTPTWRKSSHSGSTGDCVELAGTLGAIRDSKNPTGALTVPVVNLVERVKADQFPGLRERE